MERLTSLFRSSMLTTLLALVCVSLASAQDQSVFSPVSTPAYTVRGIAWWVFGMSAGVFVVVEGALLYAIFRFRRRQGDDEAEPPQVYGSTPIETAWFLVPSLIVLVLFLVTARTILALQKTEPPPGALEVTVVGHQWWWEFRYPSLGVTTANELHIPVSDSTSPTPTFFTLESADVVHSFWIPRLGGKTDVIPNHENVMWVEPLETGTYFGQCAEYCGTQHANMRIRVVVQTAEEFETWLASQRQPAVLDPSVAAQRRLFERTACVNCHTVRGTNADGTFGPDLTHLMSRETIGAGAAPNTPENLRAWVDDPEHFKPGANMPAMKLTPARVDSLVAFLATLR